MGEYESRADEDVSLPQASFKCATSSKVQHEVRGREWGPDFIGTLIALGFSERTGGNLP